VQKVRLLVSRVWDLLLRAKHLFVAAMADDLHIVLHLDRAARLERDRRRAAAGRERVGRAVAARP
jgi:hypothetical protein